MSDCVGVAVTEKICQNLIQKNQLEHALDEETTEDKHRKYKVHNTDDSCELKPLNAENTSLTVQ